MVKLPDDFVCTYNECGRKGGRVRLKIEEKKIPKTNKKLITTIDFSTNHKETRPVERTQHLHPYKFLTVFGVFHPDKKPVINPPKPKTTGENTESYKALKALDKEFAILGWCH